MLYHNLSAIAAQSTPRLSGGDWNFLEINLQNLNSRKQTFFCIDTVASSKIVPVVWYRLSTGSEIQKTQYPTSVFTSDSGEPTGKSLPNQEERLVPGTRSDPKIGLFLLLELVGQIQQGCVQNWKYEGQHLSPPFFMSNFRIKACILCINFIT